MKVLDNLFQVRKPGRYISKEYNSVVKNWDKIDLKVLISYPDLYEIGMSNLAISILYELLNSKKGVLCERCFAPWKDMENFLKNNKQPLYSLESKKNIDEFDLIGFTLQHELNYTNILTILELGNLKIWQKERKNKHPIIIGGGPCTFNPEPIADFFDFFIIGDAEEVILKIVEETKKWKKKAISRRELLKNVALLKGVYVPSLYSLKTTREEFLIPEVDKKIEKATVSDINKSFYPTTFVVPYVQTVHDRVNLEIMRGCPNSCKFCQARLYYGLPRVRKKNNLVSIARKSYDKTGYEEICLSSLSSGNYPGILELLDDIKEEFKEENVFISLPSLWVGRNTIKVLKRFTESKRPGLTFAPEVTSKKMKKVINKYVREKDLKQVVQFALNNGWKKIKLYYMIGLPELEIEDLKETEKFVLELLNLKTKRKVNLTLSFSTFIPKSHTPLQRANFVSEQEFIKQYNFIKNNLSKPRITWNVRSYKFSLLEAILSRGDRALGKVIYKAWQKKARFDSWSKEFNFSLWEDSFKELNVEYEKYLYPGLNKTSILPWSYIDLS